MLTVTESAFSPAMDVLRLCAHEHSGDFLPVPWDTMDYLRPYVLAGALPPGPLVVWEGGSDDTVWGAPGDNHAFRAWHDRAHAEARADFDPDGERATLAVQEAQLQAYCDRKGVPAHYRDTALSILRAEILGQLDYQQRHGVFPVRQEAFIRAYLLGPGLAVECGAFH